MDGGALVDSGADVIVRLACRVLGAQLLERQASSVDDDHA